jgi:hypothetical protein
MSNEGENIPFWENGLYVDKEEFEKQERKKKALIQASCEKKPYYEDTPNPCERPEYVPDEQQAQNHPPLDD